MNKKTKTLIIRIALFGGTAISLFFVPWIIVWAWILPLPDTIQEQVNQSSEKWFEGTVVYVDQAGKAPAFYAAGWHNRENKIPANRKALFKIASISKLYVAVAITKLGSDGRLSLDKTLADYMPELTGKIENTERITLRLMVQHRSGIPNLTDTPDFWINLPASSDEALARVFGLPASFEPGADYQYSNTNYLLLSMIIDQELGYPHFQYLREEVLKPRGMNNTFASLADVNMDQVMSGYHVGYTPDLKADEHGMLATAEDVGIFLRALNDGSMFEAGEQEIYSSIYVYDHTGLVPGYQSIARYHKDLDAVVIQFTNTTDPKGYLWNVSEVVYSRILKILRRQQ